SDLIEHDARRLVAVVEGSGVDERLERGPWLTLGLDGAVELADREGKATNDCQHAARVRVHRHDAAADLRDLHQAPGPGRLVRILGRDVDHVPYLHDVRRLLRRRSFRTIGGAELAGPLHLLERDFYGFPLGRDAAVRLARRPEANNDLGRFHLEDDAQPPGVDVGGRAHFGQLRAPVAAHIDTVDGAAPAA